MTYRGHTKVEGSSLLTAQLSTCSLFPVTLANPMSSGAGTELRGPSVLGPALGEDGLTFTFEGLCRSAHKM